MSPSIQYASFLIRLWREESAEPVSTPIDWHSEVEHIQTGEQWEFDTFEGLLTFLRREVEEGEKGIRSERPGRD
jgi:hypothetical protein